MLSCNQLTPVRRDLLGRLHAHRQQRVFPRLGIGELTNQTGCIQPPDPESSIGTDDDGYLSNLVLLYRHRKEELGLRLLVL